MLKDLTTNELSRLIFVHEHFNQLLISKVTELEDILYTGNDNISAVKKSQLQDLEMFYSEHLEYNSAALIDFNTELKCRVYQAEDDKSDISIYSNFI
jgi:hypothetical protein